LDILEGELAEIRLGKKAYPRELEDARRLIQRGLYDRFGKTIPVHILADVMDISDEKWRNAIEGYLGRNKLSLLVEPKYVKDAMEVYHSLDTKKYWSVSVVDTEKVMAAEHKVRENSLAEEIIADEAYVKSYVAFLLGNVIKCESVEELREQRIGVTAECMLYQNFQLRRMNPDSYTRQAFIGEKSMRQRQRELQQRYEELFRQKEEYDTMLADARRVLEYEYLAQTPEHYLELQKDMADEKKKLHRKEELERQMASLGAEHVDVLKEELEVVREKQKDIEAKMDRIKIHIHDKEQNIEKYRQQNINWNAEVLERKRELTGSRIQEEDFTSYMNAFTNPSFEKLIQQTKIALEQTKEAGEKAKNGLVDIRSEYLQKHPAREFSASDEDNGAYQRLLEDLSCDKILDYEKMASKQAKVAIEHFKEDFVYKIRSAIKEAYIRRDELNRIIKNLNFGKDRYQFKITRNKGVDGEYYDMFMDENLDIQPDTLSGSITNQVNMFSMEHENRYGNRINELLSIFIPPENADAKTQEEARLNMEKYADYRTYLSFEMEQIVEGEEKLVIGLSKMIKKNSGGEGQNPLYVALLASFAQAYKINLSPKLQRRPTIRLVVLDEAFSKMDAEKVASCIELIRGLGFQAIISATNDKIQNYLENVDKTFVYANPNKKSISIQEFEKKDFAELSENE